MADQQTDENKNTSSAKSEGGDEAEKKRRRRRRGKRRPDREQAEGGAETPSTESSEKEPASDEGKGEDRKRRPNRRKKKKPRTEEGEATAEAKNADSKSDKAPSDKKESKDADKGAKKDRPKRGDKKKNEKQGRNGKSDKPEKKERPKRGSVLDRRKTRGETVLEFPDDDDPIIPVAPKPTAKTVDAYIKHLRGWQREVVSTLRSIIKDQASEATEEILWSQPVYTLDGPVVYIKAFSDHVNLGFWRGNEIEDNSQRLIGEMPTMRHVTIRAVNEMDRDLFEDLVRQAFRLNKERGNAIK